MIRFKTEEELIKDYGKKMRPIFWDGITNSERSIYSPPFAFLGRKFTEMEFCRFHAWHLSSGAWGGSNCDFINLKESLKDFVLNSETNISAIALYLKRGVDIRIQSWMLINLKEMELKEKDGVVKGSIILTEQRKPVVVSSIIKIEKEYFIKHRLGESVLRDCKLIDGRCLKNIL